MLLHPALLGSPPLGCSWAAEMLHIGFEIPPFYSEHGDGESGSWLQRANVHLLPVPQILENVIRFKWGALPVEQREGIKTFLSNLIIR